MQHKRRNHTTGIGNGVGERLKKLDTIAFPTTLPAFIIVSRGPGPRFDSPGSCPSVKTQCQAHSWRISPRTCVFDIFDSPGSCNVLDIFDTVVQGLVKHIRGDIPRSPRHDRSNRRMSLETRGKVFLKIPNFVADAVRSSILRPHVVSQFLVLV